MRQLWVVAVTLALLTVGAAQSLRIDEHASKIALRGTTYDVVLVAVSTGAMRSATVRFEIIAPDGSLLASSSSSTQLKTGGNKLSASVTLPELPKKSDDLLWYRLAYNVSSNGTELGHGILPLFESRPRAGGTRLSLGFTPRMAIDAQSAPHTLFDYYNPDASVAVAPDRFIVEP